MKEEWRIAVRLGGRHEVSNLGRVRRIGRTRILGADNGRGYRQVHIYLGGGGGRRTTNKFIHHMVLETFVGPRPPGHEACHRDGNRANNRLDNLRWDTKSANKADMRLNGTFQEGSRHGMARLTERAVKEIRASKEKLKTLAERYGVTLQAVHLAKTGKSWRCVP